MVKVANGQRVPYIQVTNQFTWTMQDEAFVFDFEAAQGWRM